MKDDIFPSKLIVKEKAKHPAPFLSSYSSVLRLPCSIAMLYAPVHPLALHMRSLTRLSRTFQFKNNRPKPAISLAPHTVPQLKEMDPFTHLGVDVTSQKHKKKKGMRDRIRLVMNVMCSPPQHFATTFSRVSHTLSLQIVRSHAPSSIIV